MQKSHCPEKKVDDFLLHRVAGGRVSLEGKTTIEGSQLRSVQGQDVPPGYLREERVSRVPPPRFPFMSPSSALLCGVSSWH